MGDVQGCADELDEVVARARDTFGGDFELWLVGDLVNRGPESLRVLRTVRALAAAGRARTVLGNHELALLRTAWGERPLGAGDTFADVLEAPDRDDWIEWLRHRPIAELGHLGGSPFALVHAAVAPDWTLDDVAARARAVEARLADSPHAAARLLAAGRRRDPDADVLARLTRCRSVDARGRWSAEPPRGEAEPWHVPWSTRGHGYGIVYGHWSMQGLQVAPGLRGLDTGCVYHGWGRDGALTAWLPDPDEANPFHVPDERFWRVPARARYWNGLDA